jgi:calcineurin-like phosphoesterase family protein
MENKKEYRIKKGYELTKPLEYPKGSVFVISDLHLDHANIISYCKRPFDSVHEMNQVLIQNWNYVVKPDDTVYFVGDMRLGNSDKFIEKLNGNIYFIWGNHDTTEDVDSIYESLPLFYNGIEFLFIHDPVMIPAEFKGWTIHGHHHNKHPRLFPFFDPEKKRINVSVEMVKYQPVLLDYIHSLIIEGHTKITRLGKKMISTATSKTCLVKGVKKTDTKIGKEKIQREKGYLYFIGKDGYVWAAPMKYNTTGKKKKVGTIVHREALIKKREREREIESLERQGKWGFVAKAKSKKSVCPNCSKEIIGENDIFCTSGGIICTSCGENVLLSKKEIEENKQSIKKYEDRQSKNQSMKTSIKNSRKHTKIGPEKKTGVKKIEITPSWIQRLQKKMKVNHKE